MEIDSIREWLGDFSERRTRVLESDIIGNDEQKKEFYEQSTECNMEKSITLTMENIVQPEESDENSHVEEDQDLMNALNDKKLPLSIPYGQELPNLDLESRVRMKSMEIELLKKNYYSLLDLTKERIMREKQTSLELAELKERCNEMQTEYEIKEYEYQLQTIALQRRLRLALEESLGTCVIDDIEEEVDELNAKIRRLQDENGDMHLQIDEGYCSTRNNNAEKSYRMMNTECENLRQENKLYRKKYRQTMAMQKSVERHQKVFENAQKRMQSLSSEITTLRLRNAKLEEENFVKQQQMEKLSHEIEACRIERKKSSNNKTRNPAREESLEYAKIPLKLDTVNKSQNEPQMIGNDSDNADEVASCLRKLKVAFPHLHPIMSRLVERLDCQKATIHSLETQKSGLLNLLQCESETPKLRLQVQKELEALGL